MQATGGVAAVCAEEPVGMVVPVAKVMEEAAMVMVAEGGGALVRVSREASWAVAQVATAGTGTG